MPASFEPAAFEAALQARTDEMLAACTKCGKCFEACPITSAAGIADADPQATIAGVLDIVRTGDGPEASRKWASSCVLSGECIKVCDDGANPRFLLNMARVAMARARNEPREQRKPGVVFYTGCNVLKTPHIALLALDIMDAVNVSYHVMGGPMHCCGVVQMRTGDVDTSGRFGESTMDKLAKSKSGQVLAWCPSCFNQFTEVTLPTLERTRGSRPFEMTPFVLFLRSQLDRLRPLLRQRVDMKIALHRHTGAPGVMEAAAEILTAVPGITLVDLGQPSPGLMSNYLRAL